MPGDAPRTSADEASSPSVGLLAAALVELDRELDWEQLGKLYCEGDSSQFFGDSARQALLDTGLHFADDLARALAPSGRSLYVGAAVAELAPILCETLVLGRALEWVNLPGPEVRELERALAVVAERLGFDPPRVRTDGLSGIAARSCDHLWMVSVLDDPDTFPALHDRLYARSGELATGRGDLGVDEVRARALLDRALEALQPPCVLTTTDEELGLVAEALERRGWELIVPPHARLSGLVGDPVRICRVVASGADCEVSAE